MRLFSAIQKTSTLILTRSPTRSATGGVACWRSISETPQVTIKDLKSAGRHSLVQVVGSGQPEQPVQSLSPPRRSLSGPPYDLRRLISMLSVGREMDMARKSAILFVARLVASVTDLARAKSLWAVLNR